MAESLLENDERLEDAIEFFVHNLKGSLHLVKCEGMGRHERWIDALHLQHAQQAFHAQTATRTQTGRNGLFRHADSPLDARDMHELTLTVIAHIGDGAASFRDFDSILEGDIRPQRLDSCVHPLSISQIEDALDNVLFGEISDRIGTIGARKFLSARYRFYSDDQPGPTQLRSYCCHQSHGTAYCMGVRGTNKGLGRFDDRIVWTWMGNGFLHEAHLTDSFHDKSFHARSFLRFVASARPTHTRLWGDFKSRRGNIVSRLLMRKNTIV